MFNVEFTRSHIALIAAFGLLTGAATLAPTYSHLARAADPMSDVEAAKADIKATFGGVPSFLKEFPEAGLPGAWQEVKAIEFNDNTALSPKVKALISLAVSAQIPCGYCIWSDTEAAKQAGATKAEISEAVAVSALTRHWSTVLNGMQVDMDTYKQEVSGNFSGQ